jgi:hypothetical protein
MIRIVYLFLAALLVASCGNTTTDNPTTADLEGAWKFLSYTDANGSVNLTDSTFKLKDSTATGAKKSQQQSNYLQLISFLKQANISFKGEEMTLNNGKGQQKTSKFVLNKKDNATFMSGETMMGTEPKVFIKEGQLHLLRTEDNSEFILVKQ